MTSLDLRPTVALIVAGGERSESFEVGILGRNLAAKELVRLDWARKGKKLSNEDWVSKSDPEAKIAKMKDGTTHLAYKPEHAVDLDSGAKVAGQGLVQARDEDRIT